MNIESIKRRLLIKYPLFGSIVANSNFIAEPTLETAGTDGKNIYYNPSFIESVTDDQQTFIFAHEICHIAFDHIPRSKGKDGYLWNIATDSVTNAFLKQDGLPMVEGGVDIPEAINFDAEEMYKKLLEHKKQQQDGQNNDENQKDSQQQGSGSEQDGENHQQPQQQGSSASNNATEQNKKLQEQSNGESLTDLQEEKQQQNEQDNNKNQKDSQQQGSSSEQDGENHQQSQQQGSSDSNNATEQNKKLQEQSNGESLTDLQEEKQHDVGHDTHSLWKKSIKEQQHLDDITSKELESQKKEAIKKLTELGEVKAFNQNKIERNQQLEELRKALASESHGYGTTTNNEIRKITDIGTSEPLIDWRKLLKEAIKYDVDWSYQNAGIEDGVVTAYLEEMPKSETEIVLDTSGSIDEILLRNFLRECKNIFQTSNVKVGCFDTQFYGFTEIKNVSDIDNLPFYGGGGTNFDVAVNAFTRRVENKIIFTDGYAKMPSIPIDAIWIVFDGRKINPVGGKVIYIDDEQLERLSNYKIIKKTKVRSR